jgi:hypothetical protein
VHSHLTEQEDLLTALIKIHTDKVDIRNIMAEESKERYLSKSKSKYRQIEAQVYAQTLAEFQLSTMQNEPPVTPGDPSYYNDVMINVFLELMNWSDRTDIKTYLYNNLPKD